MKKIIKTSIIVLLLAGVGYGAYRFFFKEKPAIIEIQKEKVEKGGCNYGGYRYRECTAC